MDRTYVGLIDRGERNPSLRNVATIAETFVVTLEGVFKTSG
jgi:DNA-binding XRE family transcriptional regulator